MKFSEFEYLCCKAHQIERLNKFAQGDDTLAQKCHKIHDDLGRLAFSVVAEYEANYLEVHPDKEQKLKAYYREKIEGMINDISFQNLETTFSKNDEFLKLKSTWNFLVTFLQKNLLTLLDTPAKNNKVKKAKPSQAETTPKEGYLTANEMKRLDSLISKQEGTIFARKEDDKYIWAHNATSLTLFVSRLYPKKGEPPWNRIEAYFGKNNLKQKVADLSKGQDWGDELTRLMN